MRFFAVTGILAMLLAAFAIAVACGHDDDDSDGYGGVSGVSRQAVKSCGVAPVCERSVECGTYETRAECAAFYSDERNCVDMIGYIACECACLDDEGGCESFNLCELHCLDTHCR